MAATCVEPEQEGEGEVRAGEKMNSAWVQHWRGGGGAAQVGGEHYPKGGVALGQGGGEGWDERAGANRSWMMSRGGRAKELAAGSAKWHLRGEKNSTPRFCSTSIQPLLIMENQYCQHRSRRSLC